VEGDSGEVTMGGVVVPRIEKFKYLRSIIVERGELMRILAAVLGQVAKTKKAVGVLYDKKIPFRLKGRVYRMVIRPALLYGPECRPIKKTQGQRLMVAEMRMIRWMCDFTRLDRIRSVGIRDRVGVAPLEEKLRETRLRWFGHVKRRSVNAPVRRCEAINLLHCRRGRGRPKMS